MRLRADGEGSGSILLTGELDDHGGWSSTAPCFAFVDDLAFEPFGVGQVLTLGGRQVEVLPASHTVPACGFAVYADGGGAWVYTGDTGPCPVLRQRLTALDLRALVIETAFGNDEQTLARISGHLCPATLADELAPLPETTEVWITHIKPGEVRAVMAEVAPLAGGRRPVPCRSIEGQHDPRGREQSIGVGSVGVVERTRAQHGSAQRGDRYARRRLRDSHRPGRYLTGAPGSRATCPRRARVRRARAA